jgi:hypothetical protein
MKKETKEKEISIDDMIETMAQEVAENMDYAGLVECAKGQGIAYWSKKSDRVIKKAYKEHMEEFHGEGE